MPEHKPLPQKAGMTSSGSLATHTSRCRQGRYAQPATLMCVSLMHVGSPVFGKQGNSINSVWKCLWLLDFLLHGNVWK